MYRNVPHSYIHPIMYRILVRKVVMINLVTNNPTWLKESVCLASSKKYLFQKYHFLSHFEGVKV